MKTARKPNLKTAIETLESVVWKLERWQIRNGDRDPRGCARVAKDELMALLRELEDKANT